MLGKCFIDVFQGKITIIGEIRFIQTTFAIGIHSGEENKQGKN